MSVPHSILDANEKYINDNLKYYSSYFEALFWADVDNNEDIIGSEDLTIYDINEANLLIEFKVLDAFFNEVDEILENTDYTHEQACHDFYFTRQHHGVGFWENDHCNKEQGKKLTDIADKYGEIYLSGYNGELFIEQSINLNDLI